MQKSISLVIFLFFQSILLFHGSIVKAQNLLQNPGFEGTYGTPEYPGSAVPFFYNPNWNGNPASNVTFSSSTDAHSGLASQKIAITSINGYCYYAQKITIKGRRTLKASIWIKATSDVTIDFSLRTRLDYNPAIVTKSYNIKNIDGWQKIEIIGDLADLGCMAVQPNTTTDIDFFINFTTNSSNTVYLDDASVTDVTNSIDALPNLLANPDFEGFYQTNGLAKAYSYSSILPSASVTFSKDLANHHTGSSSQKAVINTITSATYSQPLRIPQHHILKAVVWMKAIPGSTPKVFDIILKSRIPNSNPVIIATKTNSLTISDEWQKFEIIGDTGDLVSSNLSTDNLDLLIRFNTTGTFYIDDASVTDVTNTIYTVPNLLLNSEFEGDYGTTAEYLGCASPYFFNPNWGGPSSTISCSKNSTSTIPHSGITCQQINVSDLPVGSISQFSQKFSAQQNKTLEAIVWVKSNSSTPVTIEFMLRSEKAGNAIIAANTYTLNSTSDWQMLQIIGNTALLVDTVTNNIDFLINFKSTGIIYLDDAYVSVKDAEHPVNLVANSNFEGDYGDSCLAQPYSYNPNWGQQSLSRFSRDTTAPHTGRACQKIEVTVMTDYFNIYQGVNVKGRRTFKGTAWVKSTAANPAEIDFTLRSRLTNNPPISSTSTLIVGTEWQKIEIVGSLGSYPVTDNQSYVLDFFINFRKPGTLYLDDVSITDVTDEINNLGIQSSGETIPANFFGLHINQLGTHNTWPAIDFGMLRLWDSGTKWSDVEPTSNDWTHWDAFNVYINKRNNYNITVPAGKKCDVIYTLGMSPSWASYGDFIAGGGKSVNSMTAWKNYVQKIVDTYGNDIKYWEIWNEIEVFFSTGPNMNGQSLLDLARSAYDIIKAKDNTDIVLSPNFISSKAASDFIYQCNGNYPFDVFSFHQYTDKRPENEIGVWYGYRNMLDNFGMINMPIWNTEGSNTRGFDVPAAQHNVSESQGAVSRAFILQWAYGVKNFNWYFWEPYVYIDATNPSNNDIWADKGTELSVKTSANAIPTISTGGIAYKQTVSWLLGKQMINKKVDTNNTWTITLFNPITNKNEFIVWNANNLSKPYIIPASWGTGIKVRDLAGTETTLTASSINANAAPVLIVPSIAGATARSAVNITDNSISVYPNPASEILNVNIDKTDSSYTASIYNNIGQTIMINLQLKSGTNIINLPNVSAGLYFLKVLDTKNNSTDIKFIVK